MKTKGDGQSITLGFTGRVTQIARIGFTPDQHRFRLNRNICTSSNVDIAIDPGINGSLLSPVRSDSVRWLLG